MVKKCARRSSKSNFTTVPLLSLFSFLILDNMKWERMKKFSSLSLTVISAAGAARVEVGVRLVTTVGDGDGKNEEGPRWIIIMRRCSHPLLPIFSLVTFSRKNCVERSLLLFKGKVASLHFRSLLSLYYFLLGTLFLNKLRELSGTRKTETINTSQLCQAFLSKLHRPLHTNSPTISCVSYYLLNKVYVFREKASRKLFQTHKHTHFRSCDAPSTHVWFGCCWNAPFPLFGCST